MTASGIVRKAAHAMAAAALALSAESVRAADAGDAAQGARLFLQCRACHAVAKDAPEGVGPNLYGAMGSQAGARAGYAYSKDLAASGIVWTAKTMDPWLLQPTSLAPGTKMAFQGVASPKARQDLIAYLTTLGAGPAADARTGAHAKR